MDDESKTEIDQPYEKWAQHTETVSSLVKHRLKMIVLGATAGALLGLLVIATVTLMMPDRAIGWTWIGFGLIVVGGAFSALMQNWRG